MFAFSKTSTVLAAAVFGTLAALPAFAQDTGYGQALFQSNCSVCHGPTGAGDGPVAELFSQRPSNLQHLAKENNNTFPFSEVYQSINGRRDITAHGNSEMPIWGNYFLEDALPQTFHPGVTAEDIVQGRILALVYYLQSVQEM
ncbi:cytochrome c [Marivita hallyeonensis]|uniref:Cytochrome C oxidase, cbb3-type, subunit III n=1 Tax=Marivita hallyeonensis TaxID=996342 RepID=A0A1M5NTF8_9RHOB|nr:cytochrome c [Marivita hallyeonensis]SHG92790.1 Cytochrome C oxidase, cbb3-type, subunit III [Marivita hallyeonensis]